MKKIKYLIFLLAVLIIFTAGYVIASSEFTASANITVSSVSFGTSTADLLVLADSSSESWSYDNGIFTVTNPDSVNIFKVASADALVKAIQVLDSFDNIVACVKNSNPGVSYVALPIVNGVYKVNPTAIDLANTATYNSVCGAASCNSGYQLSGNGASAICVASVSSGGGGGGGGAIATPQCQSVVYSDWGSCMSGMQFRSIISQSPTSCALSTSQQLEGQRACDITATSTASIIEEENIEELTESTTHSTNQVSSEKIKEVVAEEKKLSTIFDNNLSIRLAGKILLQVENHGQAWYLEPVSLNRFYLADGPTAFEVLRKFGLGINNKDLNKIPIGLDSRFKMLDSDGDGLPDKLEEAIGTDQFNPDTDGDGYSDYEEVMTGYDPFNSGSKKIFIDLKLVNRLNGRILLQVESRGEAWYLNPVDGKRYYLSDGIAAFEIMKYLSLGINNENIRKIKVSD